MPNAHNLRPIRTTERARELGRLGGIKSGEVRRKRRETRKLVKAIVVECLKNIDKAEPRSPISLIVKKVLDKGKILSHPSGLPGESCLRLGGDGGSKVVGIGGVGYGKGLK